MKFNRLVAPTLKELFICQIRDKILSGQLPIRSQLPTERIIAEQMQVSRAVVNGGFVELEKQGFLEIRARQGVFVADYRKNGNISTLTAIMEYHDGSLGKTEIRSILDVRRGLEYMAASGAIKTASTEDIERLASTLESIREAPSIEETVNATFSFHHNLSIISGNSILPLIYVSFKPVVSQLWRRYCVKYGTDLLFTSTAELYYYIKERDEKGARKTTDAHLDDAISGKHQIY